MQWDTQIINHAKHVPTITCGFFDRAIACEDISMPPTRTAVTCQLNNNARFTAFETNRGTETIKRVANLKCELAAVLKQQIAHVPSQSKILQSVQGYLAYLLCLSLHPALLISAVYLLVS